MQISRGLWSVPGLCGPSLGPSNSQVFRYSLSPSLPCGSVSGGYGGSSLWFWHGGPRLSRGLAGGLQPRAGMLCLLRLSLGVSSKAQA